ncbi:hypothetical protein ACH347_23850 [Saccharopolyspora sp. 5N102]|uniref:hypothetical protein n=1 Tax=Saccharopolyspora sp. 5N102 TaxID=3375155 RepID=UPI00379F5738
MSWTSRTRAAERGCQCIQAPLLGDGKLFLLNTAFLAAALPKWFRDMARLDGAAAKQVR